MDFSFIRFEDTIALAQGLDFGPALEQNYIGTVQLLPGDTQPYIQITNKRGGFQYSTSDYRVYVRVCREGNLLKGEEPDFDEFEVTQNFLMNSFVDADGFQQAYFRIAAITRDFGDRLVYFRFQRYSNITKNYYSNLLYLTSTDIHLTTRIDYFVNLDVNNPGDFFQPKISRINQTLLSTRLRMYYIGYQSNTEVDSYYQLSTEQNVNSRILQQGLSRWYIPLTNEWIFRRLENAAYNGGWYLNLVRQYLTEGLEYNPPLGFTLNVSEQEFVTDPNESDVFRPIYTNPADPVFPFLASNNDPLVLASSDLYCSQEEYYQI